MDGFHHLQLDPIWRPPLVEVELKSVGEVSGGMACVMQVHP